MKFMSLCQNYVSRGTYYKFYSIEVPKAAIIFLGFSHKKW